MRDLRRLSGGASRVTSAFELEAPGAPPRPLILQMERGEGAAQRRKGAMEARAAVRRHGTAGVPVPAVVAMGEHDALGADWLVVERLEGETIPRKILRDAEWAAARRALAGAVRPGPGRDPHHRPRHHRRPAAGRPAAATRCPTSTCSARCGPPSSSACAGWPRTVPPADRG